MTIDGSDVVIPAMSVVTVPRNCVHGFVFKAQTRGFVFSIPSNEVATMMAPDVALAEIFGTANIIPATDKFVRVLETLNDEYQSGGFARASLLRGLAIQLACYLAASEASKRQMVNPVHAKVTKFETLAREHFADRWKVSDFATSLGLSTTHLNRLCREVLGQSPKAYLNNLTIQEAKRLLAYTKIDVASIGYRIGIDDPSYFSRVFMRQTGQSPRDFRAKYEIE